MNFVKKWLQVAGAVSTIFYLFLDWPQQVLFKPNFNVDISNTTALRNLDLAQLSCNSTVIIANIGNVSRFQMSMARGAD